MEIEFALMQEDIIILAKHQSQRSPAFIRQQRIRRFGYMVGFIMLAVGTWLTEQQILVPLTFFGLAIVSFLCYPQFQMWQLGRKVHQAYQQEHYRASLGPRTLKATEEGLEEISEFGEIKVKWESLKGGIIETPSHCLISVHRFPSLIIPKDQIDPKVYADFIQMCHSHTQDTLAKLLELKKTRT